MSVNPPVVVVTPPPTTPPSNASGKLLQQVSLVAAACVFVVIVAACAAILVSGKPAGGLGDPGVQRLLGYGVEILVALLGFAGLGGAVNNVHLSLNSRLDQFLLTTAQNAFQQGQTAGPAQPTTVRAPFAAPAQATPENPPANPQVLPGA